MDSGSVFVLVTGKRASSYKNFSGLIPHDFALLEHGCVIFERGKLNSEWAKLMEKAAGKRRKGVLWGYESKLRKEGLKTDSSGRLATFRVYIDKPRNLSEKQKLDIEGKVEMEAGSIGLTTTRSHETLDVLPKAGGKANAMRYLLKKLHASEMAAIAIGDADNDISMMRVAGFAMCPGNANNRVKKLVRGKVGYVSRLSGHEGAVDVLQHLVEMLKA